MENILTLCPSMRKLSLRDRLDAIVRMCCAHCLNGGAYIGVFATAEKYLKGIQ